MHTIQYSIIIHTILYIIIVLYAMMKPPFKASDSAINVLHAPWFGMYTVWFMASLSYINMTLTS